jgi:Asp-tRNA(Asn)/Glu-tRNA(Gln) amidotransferase A subunit family amidase
MDTLLPSSPTKSNMETPELWQLSVEQIAKVVREGDVCALEVVNAHIARIEEVNPALNAVVVKCYKDAREAAQAIDTRRKDGEPLPLLAGVPVTIKDSIDVEGLPSTFGLPSRKDDIATSDDIHVSRLRRAGAIILGKSNVSQLLFYVEADNPLYGRTNNPWNAPQEDLHWALERTLVGACDTRQRSVASPASSPPLDDAPTWPGFRRVNEKS